MQLLISVPDPRWPRTGKKQSRAARVLVLEDWMLLRQVQGTVEWYISSSLFMY